MSTVKDCGAEGPVVGAGFVTVTIEVPAVARSVTKMAAESFVLLTNVVVRLVPLNCRVAPFTKPVPLTVREKAAAPTVALEGDREERVGDALLMMKETAVEVPPPGAGLVTVTLTTPTVRMSGAVMAAVN